MKKRLHRVTLRQKLFFGMALLMLAAIAVIGVFSYQNAAHITHAELAAVMDVALSGIVNDLNNRFEVAAETAERIAWSPDVRRILSKPSEGYAFSDQLEDFRTLESVVAVSSSETYIFLENDSMIARERNRFFSMESLREMEESDVRYGIDNGRYWGRIYLRKLNPTVSYRALACFCNVRQQQDVFRDVGTVAVLLPTDDLSALLDAVTLTENTGIVVVDTQDNVLAQSTIAGKSMAPEGEEPHTISRELSIPGWRVVATVPQRDLQEPLNQVLAFYLALSATVLFVVLLLSMGLSTSITQRITRLATLIGKQGVSDALVFSPVEAEDEIGVLQNAYNTMLHDRRQLVDQLYLGTIRQQDAELKALEAQINPHFLYNTLDTMNWMALEAGATQVSEMITALARLFRLSLGRTSSTVSVRADLEHAVLYLELLKRRMGDALTYTVDVDEAMMDISMLKLTLQPLVENAVKHGIGRKPSQAGLVRIRGWLEDGFACLCVEDDGPGIENAETLLGKEGEYGSYGIRLTNERIKLAYGEEYGLSFSTSDIGGACVMIKLPE